jgi:hypothetical protein
MVCTTPFFSELWEISAALVLSARKENLSKSEINEQYIPSVRTTGLGFPSQMEKRYVYHVYL